MKRLLTLSVIGVLFGSSGISQNFQERTGFPKELSVVIAACEQNDDALGFCANVEGSLDELGTEGFCSQFPSLCTASAGHWNFMDGMAQATIQYGTDALLPGGDAQFYLSLIEGKAVSVETAVGPSGVLVMAASTNSDPSTIPNEPQLTIQFGSLETMVAFPTRVFSGPNQFPPSAYFGYGMLIYGESTFLRTSSQRNHDICQAFFNSMPPDDEIVPHGIKRNRQFATIFPVSTDIVATSLNYETLPDCEIALNNYGHLTAQFATVAARKSGFEGSGRGPWLVGWVPASMMGQLEQQLISLDMSDVDNYDQALELFLRWKKDIYEVTTQEDDFEPTLRENLRKWSDDIGDAVLLIFGYD